ncbi:hypothetical protein IMPERIA89_80031 [Imperialibacter sp. 89]|nr:hypothetical protein IMPERIA89_80031 [Imperialibacter sp. 89]CAD5299719.1 hypothetical protein IMPERIA75_90031 [Imperialibacter sp. 75]
MRFFVDLSKTMKEGSFSNLPQLEGMMGYGLNR